MDGKIQRAELTQKVQRKSITDLGHTVADFRHPAGLKRITMPLRWMKPRSKCFLSSRKDIFIYCCCSFCSSLTKVASFITQIKYTADSISFCFLNWGLIFVTDTRNSWTSSACIKGGNRSNWDQGLLELLSLVSVRQQDWELGNWKLTACFSQLCWWQPTQKEAHKNPYDDYYFIQNVQLTVQPNTR